MQNVFTTLEVAYKDQAQPSQNVLCYCLDYLERALAKKYCRWCVRNLRMLLEHLHLEKVRVTSLPQ